jgi:hypothetical protein
LEISAMTENELAEALELQIKVLEEMINKLVGHKNDIYDMITDLKEKRKLLVKQLPADKRIKHASFDYK